MKLSDDVTNEENGDVDDTILFRACPDEIADIRWISVKEYCAQERWQGSPVYKALNDSIRQASERAMRGEETFSTSTSRTLFS